MTPDLVAMYGQADVKLGTGFAVLALILALVDASLKAIALRKAAQKKHILRFIFLFVFNTVGILPLLYIFIFSKKGEKQAEQAISKFAKKVEHQAEEIIDDAEESIEETVKKVEKLLKKAPVIGKKSVAKKTPAKKTK